MWENKFLKRVLECKFEDRRRLGRPRLLLEDRVRRDVQKLGLKILWKRRGIGTHVEESLKKPKLDPGFITTDDDIGDTSIASSGRCRCSIYTNREAVFVPIWRIKKYINYGYCFNKNGILIMVAFMMPMITLMDTSLTKWSVCMAISMGCGFDSKLFHFGLGLGRSCPSSLRQMGSYLVET